MPSYPQMILKASFGLALALSSIALAWAQTPDGSCPPSFVSQDQIAALSSNKTTPKNAGFLWSMTKNGRTSWLYGTIHVNSIAFARPGPEIMSALQSSNVFAPEVDPSDISFLEGPNGVNSTTAFKPTKAQVERLRKVYLKECLGELPPNLPITLALMSPVIAQAKRLDLWSMFSPDMVLMQRASRLGLAVKPLETTAEQMAALNPASSTEATAYVDKALNDLETNTARSQLMQMSKAWQSNDWSTIVAMEKTMRGEQPQLSYRILDRRNVLMAMKIDIMHQEGKRVFAAVGAMHMAGKMGLTLLMQDKGYVVTYVPLRNN